MERNVIRVAGESCRAPRGSRANRCSRTLFDTIYTVWTSAARVAMIDSGFTVERMAAMSPPQVWNNFDLRCAGVLISATGKSFICARGSWLTLGRE